MSFGSEVNGFGRTSSYTGNRTLLRADSCSLWQVASYLVFHALHGKSIIAFCATHEQSHSNFASITSFTPIMKQLHLPPQFAKLDDMLSTSHSGHMMLAQGVFSQ